MRYRMLTVSAVIFLCFAFASNASAQATIVTAAESGDLETVTRLLEQDPKLIEERNSEGDTALHAAAGCRRGEPFALPIVRLLLEKGASVEMKNASDQTPLLYAAYAGFRQVVELLIAEGAAVRYQDRNGRSPLHFAARQGHPGVVELLIRKGADPSLKDSQGQTPLGLAVLRGRTAVVETLMRLVEFDARSEEGTMILHSAAAQGNESLVKTLIERGADPSRPSPNGDTILLSYLRGGLAVRAAESIARGADVKAKDTSGRTALHLAAEKGLEGIVSALLEKGADPGAADAYGKTPLEIAREWAYPSLAALLTAKGARPTEPRVHLLKGGAFEMADPPTGGQAGLRSAVVRYLGNEGFLIQSGSRSVMVDGLVRNPFGYVNTPERALELMKARQDPFGRIDILLFSHAHRDHFDPELALEVLAAHPEAFLAGDRLVSEELREADPEACRSLGARIVTVDVRMGERTGLVSAGIPLTVLGVNHGTADRPYLTLGYIMDLDGFRVYHQGDIFPESNLPFLESVPWEEMGIDIAFFDPFFFQDEKARRIALERIKPSAVILMHLGDSEVDRHFTELRPVVPQLVVFRAPMERKTFVKPGR